MVQVVGDRSHFAVGRGQASREKEHVCRVLKPVTLQQGRFDGVVRSQQTLRELGADLIHFLTQSLHQSPLDTLDIISLTRDHGWPDQRHAVRLRHHQCRADGHVPRFRE